MTEKNTTEKTQLLQLLMIIEKKKTQLLLHIAMLLPNSSGFHQTKVHDQQLDAMLSLFMINLICTEVWVIKSFHIRQQPVPEVSSELSCSPTKPNVVSYQ